MTPRVRYFLFFFNFFFNLQLLKKEPGQNISFPLDFRHTITVQQFESRVRTDTPPGSPAIPRLKAIARK